MLVFWKGVFSIVQAKAQVSRGKPTFPRWSRVADGFMWGKRLPGSGMSKMVDRAIYWTRYSSWSLMS